MGGEVKELLRWLCALSLMRETGTLPSGRKMLTAGDSASGQQDQICTEGKGMRYTEEKIRACIAALDDIEVKGTDNMMRVIFIKQTLERPEKEETDGCSSK